MTSDSPSLQRLDQALFDRVASEARSLPRLRRNHNLHQESDPVQRFLNVMQPGTYVRPHRHLRSRPGAGFECFVVLQGAIGLLLLDCEGQVLQRERLAAAGPLRGIQLAEGILHTLVALEPDSVMMEIKEGPYEPTADKDFLTSFPAEGSDAAREQERRWRGLFATAGETVGETAGEAVGETAAP
jgi:cupin fold WbuC family metalloprotein